MSEGNTVLTQPPADNQGTPPVEKAVTPVENQQQSPPIVDWRSGLSDELKGEKMFENIKGKDAAEVLPALAKGYRDAQKLVGGSMGKIPGADAKPEEIAAWKKDNLGKLAAAGLIETAPESVDKYTARLVPPEGLQVDEPSMANALGKMHALGLSNAQAQGMFDLFAAEGVRARGELGTNAKETMKELEKEWGGAVQNNLDLGHRAVLEVGGQELMQLLDRTGLGNHPALIKAFVKVGGILSEDNPVFADIARGGSAEAKNDLAKIMNDTKHAYWSANNDAAHKAAVAEVTRLNQIAYAQTG